YFGQQLDVPPCTGSEIVACCILFPPPFPSPDTARSAPSPAQGSSLSSWRGSCAAALSHLALHVVLLLDRRLPHPFVNLLPIPPFKSNLLACGHERLDPR